jgi:hypothetical protein
LPIFTESADPFEGDKNYSKFAAYAMLERGGDFSKAAIFIRLNSLRRQG